jgi:hypothetical protein
MARVTSNTERWFEVPGDPDGARVLIRHLKPGAQREIEEAASKTVATGASDGQMALAVELNSVKRLALIVERAVVGWDGFYDQAGAAMPCNSANKTAALLEFEWFGPLVDQAVTELRAEAKAAAEAARKN